MCECGSVCKKFNFDVSVLLFKGSDHTSQDHLVAHPPDPCTALKVEIFNVHVAYADQAKRRAANLFDVMAVENADDLRDGERFFAWVKLQAVYERRGECALGVTLTYSASFLLFALPRGRHRELDVIEDI
jgi:hypothetical protein